MQVTPTSAASSAGSTASNSSAAASAATVDYNSFLKLLVAEMQSQDPTNPTDPTQFMSQLASFSNVEQAIQTNNKLDTMLTTSALSQADQAIGRTVTSSDGSVSGRIVSVSIASGGGLTATLDSGATLSLSDGVTIS